MRMLGMGGEREQTDRETGMWKAEKEEEMSETGMTGREGKGLRMEVGARERKEREVERESTKYKEINRKTRRVLQPWLLSPR